MEGLYIYGTDTGTDTDYSPHKTSPTTYKAFKRLPN